MSLEKLANVKNIGQSIKLLIECIDKPVCTSTYQAKDTSSRAGVVVFQWAGAGGNV